MVRLHSEKKNPTKILHTHKSIPQMDADQGAASQDNKEITQISPRHLPSPSKSRGARLLTLPFNEWA